MPEDKDVPARVTLLEIPKWVFSLDLVIDLNENAFSSNNFRTFSRNEIRNKNLFNVADCKIFWQKSGDYLCVKVDRFAKRKEKTEQKYTVSWVLV